MRIQHLGCQLKRCIVMCSGIDEGAERTCTLWLIWHQCPRSVLLLAARRYMIK